MATVFESGPSITALLQQLQSNPNDPEAASRFARAVYGRLRRIAADKLRSEDGTLSTATDLVHEFWMQLDVSDLRADSREHFFRAAARAMRHLLVDKARRRMADKHGAGMERVSLKLAETQAVFSDVRLLTLDAALERLHRDYPRCAEVAQLHCFGGVKLADIATSLNVSLSTVKRDWVFASAWLNDALRES